MPTHHIIIPFAYMDCFATPLQQEGLQLPYLDHLLKVLHHQTWFNGNELSPSFAHEHALLQILTATHIPVEESASAANIYAAQQGYTIERKHLDTQKMGWAFLTPCHFQVTPDRIILQDPTLLELSEAHARSLFNILQDWFVQDGITLIWDSPNLWLAYSEKFVNLTTSSIERAIQRDVRQWLPRIEVAPQLQRLQTEVQMLFYNLPINDERMASGQLPINALWISGTGRQLPAITEADFATVQIHEPLKSAALHGSWAAWKMAFEALDRTLFKTLVEKVHAGESIHLTLGGERNAVTLLKDNENNWFSRLKHKALAPWRKDTAISLLERL